MTRAYRVTQHVELVYGEQSQKLDTCLVWYKVENYGTAEHKVGVRVMLDTYIGANDGVPFVIPGQPGTAERYARFQRKGHPRLHRSTGTRGLVGAGTAAHLGLKGITLPEGEPQPIVEMLHLSMGWQRSALVPGG